MTKMTSREQFEIWVGDSVNSDVHRGIMLSRHENGNYSHLATRHKWDAWQASRSSIELNLTSEWDISSDGSRHYDADYVDEQLLALGIKVKK